MLYRLILVFVLVVAPVSAWAEFPGDQDPRFSDALETWLSGADDLGALRSLSVLGNDGNTAAQITLGLILRQGNTLYEATKDLPEEERRWIRRKKDGRFGKSWMTVAAADHPLAALLTKRGVTDFAAYAMSLADAGAIRTAIKATMISIGQSNRIDALRAFNHPALLPYTKLEAHWYATFLLLGASSINDDELSHEVTSMAVLLPSLTFSDYLLMSEWQLFNVPVAVPLKEDTLRLRGEGLLLHPDLGPMISAVAAVCPEDTAYHLGLLFYLKGGTDFRDALISPLEPIVSTAEWRLSGRFLKDFFAQWSLSEKEYSTLENLSPCLFQAASEG